VEGASGWGQKMADHSDLSAQCILMLEAALRGLRSIEAETDVIKIRGAVSAVEKTLADLLELATEADITMWRSQEPKNRLQS
jgi:hypothetical protein